MSRAYTVRGFVRLHSVLMADNELKTLVLVANINLETLTLEQAREMTNQAREMTNQPLERLFESVENMQKNDLEEK